MRYSDILMLCSNKRAQFANPQEFLRAAAEYFDWCVDHPLYEEQVFQYKGDITRADKKKVRVFTREGLCTFLNIPLSRIDAYRRRGDDWEEAIEIVDQIIRTQKFEGAAAGLLNPGMITRDLGLVDKQVVETTAPEEAPDESMIANRIHPDDPDPLNLPRPLYSQAQIDAGVPFFDPNAAQMDE